LPVRRRQGYVCAVFGHKVRVEREADIPPHLAVLLYNYARAQAFRRMLNDHALYLAGDL
jgi:hypothetical protein